MSDEAKPDIYVEPQPSAHAQSDREWMVSATRRAEEANRAERAAEESARAERESGTSAPVAAKPAPKPPAAPKPTEASGSTVQERIAAREEHRREVEAARYQAAQLENYARSIQPDAHNYRAAKAAWASRDLDRLAELVGAGSFDDLVTERIKTLADPGHARVVELERRIAERDAQERQAHEQAQAHAAHRQRQENIARLKYGLSERMKASSDPILSDFHNDSNVVEPLFAAMVRHYQATGEDLTGNPEKALNLKQPNGMTILEGLESYGSFADRYRAARARKAAPAAQAHTKPKTAPKPKAETEQRYGWQPSTKRDEDTDWLARGRRDLTRAFGEERRREGR